MSSSSVLGLIFFSLVRTPPTKWLAVADINEIVQLVDYFLELIALLLISSFCLFFFPHINLFFCVLSFFS